MIHSAVTVCLACVRAGNSLISSWTFARKVREKSVKDERMMRKRAKRERGRKRESLITSLSPSHPMHLSICVVALHFNSICKMTYTIFEHLYTHMCYSCIMLLVVVLAVVVSVSVEYFTQSDSKTRRR